MKEKTHRICTFLFNNITTIIVAVPAFDAEMRDRPYEEMLDDAKRIGWNGDEIHGRGNIRSFTVGELVVVGTMNFTKREIDHLIECFDIANSSEDYCFTDGTLYSSIMKKLTQEKDRVTEETK